MSFLYCAILLSILFDLARTLVLLSVRLGTNDPGTRVQFALGCFGFFQFFMFGMFVRFSVSSFPFFVLHSEFLCNLSP